MVNKQHTQTTVVVKLTLAILELFKNSLCSFCILLQKIKYNKVLQRIHCVVPTHCVQHILQVSMKIKMKARHNHTFSKENWLNTS